MKQIPSVVSGQMCITILQKSAMIQTGSAWNCQQTYKYTETLWKQVALDKSFCQMQKCKAHFPVHKTFEKRVCEYPSWSYSTLLYMSVVDSSI